MRYDVINRSPKILLLLSWRKSAYGRAFKTFSWNAYALHLPKTLNTHCVYCLNKQRLHPFTHSSLTIMVNAKLVAMPECIPGFNLLKQNHMPCGVWESLAGGFREQGFYFMSLFLWEISMTSLEKKMLLKILLTWKTFISWWW